MLVILGVFFVSAMLFLPAGSLKFWNAYGFMAVVFIPVIFVMAYFLKHDPELLVRRIKFKEKESMQKTIIKLASLIFFVGFLVPGFDFRFGWSSVPFWLVVASDIVILLGYLLIFLVFKVNSYASRIIVVEKNQKVITRGPYAIVRHPMYVGVVLMYLSIPTALGSFWALVFFAPLVPIIVFRILNEEKVLLRELKGYAKYTRKVKYRLIPGIW